MAMCSVQRVRSYEFDIGLSMTPHYAHVSWSKAIGAALVPLICMQLAYTHVICIYLSSVFVSLFLCLSLSSSVCLSPPLLVYLLLSILLIPYLTSALIFYMYLLLIPLYQAPFSVSHDVVKYLHVGLCTLNRNFGVHVN